MERSGLIRMDDADLTVADGSEDIRGRTVVDTAGEEIGTIDSLLIDEAEQRVRFVEIASGGFLGIGGTKRLLPVDAITAVQDGNVLVDQERGRVADSPGYDPDVIPEPDQAYYEGLYGYYGYAPYWTPGYVYPFPARERRD